MVVLLVLEVLVVAQALARQFVQVVFVLHQSHVIEALGLVCQSQSLPDIYGVEQDTLFFQYRPAITIDLILQEILLQRLLLDLVIVTIVQLTTIIRSKFNVVPLTVTINVVKNKHQRNHFVVEGKYQRILMKNSVDLRKNGPKSFIL